MRINCGGASPALMRIDINGWVMNDIYCPHCEAHIADPHTYFEHEPDSDRVEATCYGCGKTFWVSRRYTVEA